MEEKKKMEKKEKKKYSTEFYLKLGVLALLLIFVVLPMLIPLRDFERYAATQQSSSRREESEDSGKLSSALMLDKCHLFSGTMWTEEERSLIPRNAPFSFNPAISSLQSEESQMMCLLLFDRVRSRDALIKSYGGYFTKIEERFRLRRVDDGISYFFYDLGDYAARVEDNLSYATEEMNNIEVFTAPVDVDYVVLSLLSKEHYGGALKAMMKFRPDLPVFIPPGEEARVLARSYGVKNLIKLPEGYTQMSSRVGILVLPWKDRRGREGYEADLVITIKDGVALIAGEGSPGMEHLIAEAERVTGRDVLLYVGGTAHMEVLEDEAFRKSVEKLAESHPALRICANYSTSFLAARYFREAFGVRYLPVFLGTSISLPHPSFLYRTLGK